MTVAFDFRIRPWSQSRGMTTQVRPQGELRSYNANLLSNGSLINSCLHRIIPTGYKMSGPSSRATSLFSSYPSTPVPSMVSRDPDSLDAWILGSGIASLTAAVHLIREAKVPPSRIHILETLSEPGAGSVSKGDAESGYHFRAECMPRFCGNRMEELLALVPSERPGKTVWDDIREYFEEHVSKKASRTRFLARQKNGLERIGRRRLHLGVKDRMDLFRLSSRAEDGLGRSRIQDHFSEGFFRTEYWLVPSTL